MFELGRVFFSFFYSMRRSARASRQQQRRRASSPQQQQQSKQWNVWRLSSSLHEWAHPTSSSLLLLCWRACYSNMRRRCCCAHQTILMECIKMSAGGSSGTASACGLSALLGAGHCWCIFLNSRGIEYYLHFHHIHIQTCILLGDLGFGSSNLKYLLL